VLPTQIVNGGLSPTRSLHQPSVRAWALLAAFIGLTLVTLGAGRGGTLKYLYPAAALAVGLVLYGKDRPLYLGYVWWLWFLTPLVRRLVDLQGGYDSVNPVLTAPLLVTGLCLFSLLRHLPTLARWSLLPLVPILISLIYAYPIGIQNTGVMAASFSLLQWLVPVALGFHLATDVRRYPAYQATTRRAFTWAALLLGVYGIWQFINPLPWDVYWMLNADMTTIGQPVPHEVRVFSTLNSPTPFAMVMLVGLLMLFSASSITHVLVGVPAYLAFLLTLVRTAWGGWAIGVWIYASYLRPSARLRLAASVGLLAIVAATVIASPLGSRIERKVESFALLSEDKSLAVREATAWAVLELILNEPLGRGLGATGSAKRLASGGTETFDNGLLNVFFSLGWMGGLLYLGATLYLMAGLIARFEPRHDPIPKVARAVGFATFAALLSLNTLIGVSGAMFWGLLGLSIGARSWYRSAGLTQAATRTPFATRTHASAGR
jgi:hypothetical protein